MRVAPWLAFAAVLLAALPAGADFTDTDYHEQVLFEWDTAHLDILVLPPVAPYAPWRLDAIHAAIDAWQAGIQDTDLSPGWLAAGVELVRYTPGIDSQPPPGFELDDPEIVVLATEPGAAGTGAAWEPIVCGPLGDACGELAGNACLVAATNWETTQVGMQDLVAHQLGHCLGIGDVGDGDHFLADNVPPDDIMGSDSDPAHVRCVSSLNTLALAAVFAGVVPGAVPPDVESPPWDPGSTYVSQSPWDYTQRACANPPAPPLPDPDWFPLD